MPPSRIPPWFSKNTTRLQYVREFPVRFCLLHVERGSLGTETSTRTPWLKTTIDSMSRGVTVKILLHPPPKEIIPLPIKQLYFLSLDWIECCLFTTNEDESSFHWVNPRVGPAQLKVLTVDKLCSEHVTTEEESQTYSSQNQGGPGCSSEDQTFQVTPHELGVNSAALAPPLMHLPFVPKSRVRRWVLYRNHFVSLIWSKLNFAHCSDPGAGGVARDGRQLGSLHRQHHDGVQARQRQDGAPRRADRLGVRPGPALQMPQGAPAPALPHHSKRQHGPAPTGHRVGQKKYSYPVAGPMAEETEAIPETGAEKQVLIGWFWIQNETERAELSGLTEWLTAQVQKFDPEWDWSRERVSRKFVCPLQTVCSSWKPPESFHLARKPELQAERSAYNLWHSKGSNANSLGNLSSGKVLRFRNKPTGAPHSCDFIVCSGDFNRKPGNLFEMECKICNQTEFKQKNWVVEITSHFSTQIFVWSLKYPESTASVITCGSFYVHVVVLLCCACVCDVCAAWVKASCVAFKIYVQRNTYPRCPLPIPAVWRKITGNILFPVSLLDWTPNYPCHDKDISLHIETVVSHSNG